MSVRLAVMRPFAASVFGVSLLGAVGCGGGAPVGAGDAASATTTGNQCGRAAGIGASTPGACGGARAAIDCEFPNGAGCDCITDNASCEGCSTGATCTNKCAANEYAVSCGAIGPGDPSITYADAPAGCRLAIATPAGIAFYCCPCL
jgi:hypothetical protein